RLQKMGQSEADIVKMAVMPHDEADVLALMNATHQASTLIDQPLITMSMGRLGKITRIAGEIFKSTASFATIEGMSSAPGQMAVEDVEECMNLLNLRVDDLDDDDF
ncbi:type I 3-dehydroquinate dehydratase, partial [Aerococcus urinaeequi]|uniref:type I 3-dehydroquinate dehydratase n=1 Tax=Aerococcus urinaeequi TaxID=51665 RepID=UPI003D6B78C8